jgi:hypothetical protein
MPPLKISHDQIRDAVRRSGYLLEYRIEQVLGRYGYNVEANQAYPDPITGKSRELEYNLRVRSIPGPEGATAAPAARLCDGDPGQLSRMSIRPIATEGGTIVPPFSTAYIASHILLPTRSASIR